MERASDKYWRFDGYNVPQLRASLRTADASPEFHKFDDLPPELQVRVCEFYVSSFPVVLGRPTQPPLARLNTAMREETLALFYKTTQFRLTIQFLPPAPGETRLTMRMAPESLLFLLNLREKDLALLRKLLLDIDDMSDNDFDSWTVIDATLPTSSEPAKFQYDPQGYGVLHVLNTMEAYGEEWRVRDCQDQLLQDIEAAVREVLDTVTPRKLTLAHLTRLVSKVERVCWDTADRIKWW
ncbi:hypothetical protein CKM354_000746700 [Cercospora kikuchii]|uniref:Uncharacterized protein n=1 Tax=Cercospora kikuchii TaxID=84275 RepID=A0A9P3FIU1_9PEZI|nr:uncharacterized protein CKM354_000746700 [Cercospora kikuchii]GIZ44264.1 hypothetical protein CKM354_000746700 [Cercospora kikuchii]